MKSNNVEYQIRELIFFKDLLMLDYLYDSSTTDFELAELIIAELKAYDKKHNPFKLKHIYVIEVKYGKK